MATRYGGAEAEGPGWATSLRLNPESRFRIFLNYRREDAAGHVGRLWDALRGGIEGEPGFAHDQIFMDIDTIEPGVDFRVAIRKAVEVSDVFITVIGRQWLTVVDSKGRRRLDNPGDFVRIEIEAALERAAEHHDVRVVPTRVEGAPMPDVEDLPDTLVDLAHRNAIELTDERWHYDVGRLLAWLKKLERDKMGQTKADLEAAEVAEREREAIEREKREQAEAAQLAERERAAIERAKREQAELEAAQREIAERAERERIEREEQERKARRAQQERKKAAKAKAAERAELPRELPIRDEAQEQRRRQIRRRGAAAAIVVAAAAGVALLIGLLRNGEQPSDGKTPPPPPPPRSGALVWERAGGADFGGPGDQAMTSIVNTRRGGLAYLAGGYDASSGNLDAAIWTSTDGRDWQLTPAEEDFEGAGDQTINSVTDFGGALVAVGTDNSNGDLDIAVWRSSDGIHWDAATGLRVPGSDEVINRVNNTTIGGLRVLVGAGWQTGDGDDGAVWILPGGEAILDPDAPLVSDADFGGPGDQRINRVVQVGQGTARRLVAVGFADGDAGVWVSQDGQAWDRVDVAALGGEGDQEILDATVFESKVVAVGRENTRGSVWLSEDGRSWTRVSDREGIFATSGPVRLNRVIDPGSALIASGVPALIAGGSAGGDAAVWTSENGMEWAREPDAPGEFGGQGEQTIHSFRVKRLPVIAVGSSGPKNRLDAVVWLGANPG